MMLSERSKATPIGFGFLPGPRAAYHFVVTLPGYEDGMVTVAEHFVYEEEVETAAARERFSEEASPYAVRPPQIKVEISYHKFQRLAEEVRVEFNRRLRQASLKAGNWKPGENRLAPHLGKELVLLLWAIEEADPSLIPNAISNWQGLAPEERWWLYTTINAATGHAVEGRNRGWRKAIGIAFTENPVTQRPYFSQNENSVPGSEKVAVSVSRNGKRKSSPRKTEPPSSADPQLPFVGEDIL